MGWQSCAVHPPCGCAAPSITWGGWMGQPRPTDTPALSAARVLLRAKYQGAPWAAVELGVEMARLLFGSEIRMHGL